MGSFLSFFAPWKSHFMFLSHLATPRGTPGGVRSRFRRVLSSLWSKRISTQGSVSLGPGAGGHRLGRHGGLLRLRKVVFGSQFTFLVSILEFWWHPQKSIFFTFWITFGRSQGCSRELLGCQIWRLFEHFGSIFWPVGDLMTSLHRLVHRRSCQNSSMGLEMCVTSYHTYVIANKGPI